MNTRRILAKLMGIAVAGSILFGSCAQSSQEVKGSGTIEATEVTVSARSQLADSK